MWLLVFEFVRLLEGMEVRAGVLTSFFEASACLFVVFVFSRCDGCTRILESRLAFSCLSFLPYGDLLASWMDCTFTVNAWVFCSN